MHDGYAWEELTVAAACAPLADLGVRAEPPVVRAPDGTRFKVEDASVGRHDRFTLIGEHEFASCVAEGIFIPVPDARAYRRHVAAVATAAFVEAMLSAGFDAMAHLPWLLLPRGVAWTYVERREWESWTAATAAEALDWTETKLRGHLHRDRTASLSSVHDLLAHVGTLIPDRAAAKSRWTGCLGVLFIAQGDEERCRILEEQHALLLGIEPSAVHGAMLECYRTLEQSP